MIFVFNSHAVAKADDIKDFEIEGVSIGDSLFDHITLNQFNNWEEYKYYYKDKKFVECPGPENQRLGDYRNEFKLERVSGHKRSKDGTKCITLYEEVPFIEQYIPNTSQLISTAAIATVAASTPLLLNVIKPLIKQIFKKFTKKKDDVK